MRRQIRTVLIAIIVLFIVFIGVWSTRYISSGAKVDLTLSGPKEVLNAQENTYKFTYNNKSKDKLVNVELQLNLPRQVLVDGVKTPTLIVENIGDLDSGQKGEFDLNLALFGEEDAVVVLSAKLIYQPEDATSLFEIVKSIDVKIIGDALILNFSSANFDELGRFNSSLTMTNQDDNEIKNITLKIVYPENFNFLRANPSPKRDNNIWLFENLPGGTSSTIELTGRILGATSNLKPFQVIATINVEGFEFLLAETSSINQIVTSGLVIFQKVNNSRPEIVSWGDVLRYDLSYKNATEESLADLLVEMEFNNPALIDLSRSNFGNGNFDITRGILRFDKSNNGSLARINPNQEGTLVFEIALVNLPSFESQNKENFVFKTSAVIKGVGSIPMGQDIIEMKIKTKVFIASKIFYQNQYFTNFGPVPPRVGQKTTYTVVWELSNVSNDLTNVLAETFLGPNVIWEGNISPKNAKISYNDELRKVVWEVGTLRAGTGFSSPIKQVVFKIALMPSQEQIGQLALLIGQTKLAGVDRFTSESISIASEPIYSNLPDDPIINNQGTVQP